MEKADVTENGVNSNKLIFYKAAVPQRNVENRGEVCYSIWYVQKTRIVYFPPPVCCPSERKKGKWRRKMNLLSLLEHLEYKCLQGSTEQEVSSVVYDSRKVEEGSLFICIRGAVVDGHKFIPDVVAKGAKTLIVEEAVEAPEDVTVIQVEDTRYAMAFISAAWFGHPAEKLKTIGITGTKGKTTTTYMVKSILENAGYKVGLIGTIELLSGRSISRQPTRHRNPIWYRNIFMIW